MNSISFDPTIALGSVLHGLLVCSFIYCLYHQGIKVLRNDNAKLDQILKNQTGEKDSKTQK